MQIVVLRCLALLCVVLGFPDTLHYAHVRGVGVCQLLFLRCLTLFCVVLGCVTVLDVVVLRITQ